MSSFSFRLRLFERLKEGGPHRSFIRVDFPEPETPVKHEEFLRGYLDRGPFKLLQCCLSYLDELLYWTLAFLEWGFVFLTA